MREIVLILGILLVSQAAGDPNNGRFEFFDHNETLDINRPSGWYYDANYAAVVSSLTPRDSLWKLTTNLIPFEGDYFLLLSTGTENLNITEPYGTEIRQTINAEAGDKLTGVYFFGTIDYSGFIDWGTIRAIPIENPSQPIEIVYVTVEDVGSYGSGDTGSMSGWRRFEYTFETAGTYELNISVNDYSDSIYDSFFAVDSLVLCHNPSGAGDFSCDCTVNFEDFVFLAADWMCNCKDPNVFDDPESDPNFYNDPDRNCLLGTDLSNNGPVDVNDLGILSENWLEGTKE